MIIAALFVVVLAILAVHQRIVWNLQKQIRTLTACIGLLNDAMKLMESTRREAEKRLESEALDRIHANVFSAIADQLEADDDEDEQATKH